MSEQPTWWYDTKQFWIDYPHWRMLPSLKAYYLLQFSYWLQQLLVMVLRLEKPRTDFVELCAHVGDCIYIACMWLMVSWVDTLQHIVTLWLIGWSYFLNLTCERSTTFSAVFACLKLRHHSFTSADIGVAVFFSMDIADVFLALSKMLNYLNLQRTSEVSFAVLLCVWSYFRHWQNLRILYSVWYEYPVYVPEEARVFDPLSGRALASWMKYQVFTPIFLLQLLNLFWYALMWRIVLR